MATISSSDRKWLRGRAHELQPIVFVGNRGLTDEVEAETDKALDAHELIKVKVPLDREARKAVAAELADATGSELAGLIGHVAILFRASTDPERRKYRLPSS